jgi:hypothetical protein
MSASLLNAWTKDNPSNTIPRISNVDNRLLFLSSRFVEDASFLRLNNLTLGYKLRITNLGLRIFATGQNLFVITKYKGYDPEIASGIDLGTYPKARTFLLGLQITI